MDLSFLTIQVLKEFFDSFNILPQKDCKNESLMGMQYECTSGNKAKCDNCVHVYKRYPKLTEDKLLELITALSCEIGIKPYCKDFESLVDYTIKNLVFYRNNQNLKLRVQSIFK